MHIRQITRASCWSLCILFALVGCGKTQPDELSNGSQLPPLILTGLDGNKVAIDSFRGKFLVLNIWATWCPPCRNELPSLERLHQTLDPQHFIVVGLSVDDDVIQAREYLIDKGISFTSFIDKDMKIASDIFGIRIYPDTLLISPQGVLLRRVAGEREWDDPKIIKALEAANQGKSDALNVL